MKAESIHCSVSVYFAKHSKTVDLLESSHPAHNSFYALTLHLRIGWRRNCVARSKADLDQRGWCLKMSAGSSVAVDDSARGTCGKRRLSGHAVRFEVPVVPLNLIWNSIASPMLAVESRN